MMEGLDKELSVFKGWDERIVVWKKFNDQQVFNYDTAKGEKAARSHIFKLRKTKGALDKKRKEAKYDASEYIKKIDSEARRIRESLEEMIDVHAEPLKEIERLDKIRVDKIKDKISILHEFKRFDDYRETPEKINIMINACEMFPINIFLEEFQGEAAIEKDLAVKSLKEIHIRSIVHEKEESRLREKREADDKLRVEEFKKKIADEAVLAEKIRVIQKERNKKIQLDRESKSEDSYFYAKISVMKLFNQYGLNADQSSNLFLAINAGECKNIKIFY